jgi:DNA polymerase-3 subunit chi
MEDLLMQQKCPVLLAEQVDLARVQKQVLVNLGGTVAAGFEKFERVIEVVSVDERDRDLARLRWKYYTEQGYTIKRHDLTLRGVS